MDKKSTLGMAAVVLVAAAYLSSPASGNDTVERDILAKTTLVAQQMDDIKASQAELAKNNDAMKTTLQAESDQLKTLTDAVATYKGQLTAYSDSFSSLQTDLDKSFYSSGEKSDELKKELDALSTQLQKLQITISTIQAPPPTPIQPVTPAMPGSGGGGGDAAMAMPPATTTTGTAADRDWSVAMDDVGNAPAKAQQEMYRFSVNYPNDPHAGDAVFYVGYLMYQAKDYKDAVEEFHGLLDSYSDNEKIPDAMYYEGMSYAEEGDTSSAVTELKAYLKSYRTGKWADLAQRELTLLQAHKPAASAPGIPHTN